MARVIFLAGMGRSGTTLLERALGELPGVQPLGEVMHLWRRGLGDDELCGCGEPFSRCRFWRAVGERAFGGWDAVDTKAVLASKAAAERIRRVPQLLVQRPPAGKVHRAATFVAETHRRVYEAAAAVANASAVIDSSKHPAVAHCLRYDERNDLRVVHVVRDSRAVAFSWTKRVERPEARAGSAARWMRRHSPKRTAWRWSSLNACASLLRPGLTVRYERLVEEPEPVLREIADFASLPVRDEDFAFVSQNAVFLHPAHTVSGNRVRFASGLVPLLRDDDWLRLFPLRDRITVTAMTYPQLVHYGYSRRPGGWSR